MQYIRAKFTDPRSKSRIVYPLDSLVIVILLAYLYGQDNASLIANFYRKNNLALQLLVPGLPYVEHMLSESKVNTVVMSDALNTSVEVTDLITEKGAFYLMPVKAYRGNKELRSHIEGIFNREHKELTD